MSAQRFVPPIQGLRGLASLSVIFGHFYAMPHLSGFAPDIEGVLLSSINTLGHGVELFFLISGFLIPASLWRHRDLDLFFLDRGLRIFPLYLTLHVLLFVIGPLVGYKIFKDVGMQEYLLLFAANAVFLPNLIGQVDAQQNAWTLRFEWVFYLVSALAFKVRQVAGHRASLAVILIATIAVLIFSPISFYFIIGAFCRWRSHRFLSRFDVGGLLGIASLVLTYHFLEHVSPYAGFVPAYVFFCLVTDETTPTARLLSFGWLQFVGKISYSLYLIHPFVLFPLAAVAARLAAGGTSKLALTGGFVAVGLPLCLLVATITYELVEVRMRLAIDRRVRPWVIRRSAAEQSYAVTQLR